MNPKPIIIAIIIISAILMAIRISPEMNSEQQFKEDYIHIDSIVMEFNGPNATVNVKYNLTPFAKVYLFFLGSKNIEPKIEEIFSEFPEKKIQKIGLNNATLQITNISQISGEDYTHDSTKLGMRSDQLIIVFPDNQGTQKLQNTDSTMSVFYPVHPEKQK